MIYFKVFEELAATVSSRITAFDVSLCSIDRYVDLPQQVFVGIWESFLFCEPDWLFRPSFVDIAKRMLALENAGACCMINLSLTKIFKFEVADAFYVDANVDPMDYKTRVRVGGADAWISSADRFVCSSNSGDWVVYCEKDEDLAIIAVRNQAVVSKFKAIFDEVRATSLNIYIERPDNGPFPKTPLKKQWKSEMIKNYSAR